MTLIIVILCICYIILLAYAIYIKRNYTIKSNHIVNDSKFDSISKRVMFIDNNIKHYDKYYIRIENYKPFIYFLKDIDNNNVFIFKPVDIKNAVPIRVSKERFNLSFIRLSDLNDYMYRLSVNYDILDAKTELTKNELIDMQTMYAVLRNYEQNCLVYTGSTDCYILSNINYYVKHNAR